MLGGALKDLEVANAPEARFMCDMPFEPCGALTWWLSVASSERACAAESENEALLASFFARTKYLAKTHVRRGRGETAGPTHHIAPYCWPLAAANRCSSHATAHATVTTRQRPTYAQLPYSLKPYSSALTRRRDTTVSPRTRNANGQCPMPNTTVKPYGIALLMVILDTAKRISSKRIN